MEAHLLTGIIGLLALVALIAIRMPIAYAMILAGGVGTSILNGPDIFLAQLKNLAYSQFSIYDLSVGGASLSDVLPMLGVCLLLTVALFPVLRWSASTTEQRMLSG